MISDVHGMLSGGNLLEGAADVDGTGSPACIVGPGNGTVQCPINFEDPGTMPPPRHAPSRRGIEPATGESNGRARHHVEEDWSGRRKV